MLGRELRWDRVGWDGIGWGLGGKAYFIFNVSLFFFFWCAVHPLGRVRTSQIWVCGKRPCETRALGLYGAQSGR